MRLHRLRVRAFGPFAEEITVDFDDLGGDGLFLLHGQTGAGKTTVLDAVAFALFGRVPGVRDVNRRLHSDHAAADEVPEVELEATIASRRLRITRSPEHERPKKRGGGTRRVNARATLTWVDGSGPDLTRIPEIGDAVVRLLGMSADQFFQVVLLPQGDFARFLRAHSDEREALLERLFDTERFGDLEEWLRERSRESAATLTGQTAVLDRIAGQIVAVGGAEPIAEPDFDWAQECLERARVAAERTLVESGAAQAAADQAQAAYESGSRVAELRRRGRAATERLARLAEGEQALADAGRARRLALRAAPIVPLADDSDRAVRDLTVAEQAVAGARAELGRLPEGEVLCAVDTDEDLDALLDAAIDRWTEESGRWEPLAERIAQRPALVTEIDALDATISDAERRVARTRESLEAAPGRRAEAAGALRAAEDLRLQAPKLRAERDGLRRVRDALTDRDEVLVRLVAAEKELLDARDAHAAARERVLDARERRLAGMAVELAGELVDGEACVVCGSVAHPRPATADDPDGTVADEEEAAEAEERASAIKAIAQSAVAALGERRVHLDAVIGGADPEAVDADLARVSADLAAAERAASRVPALQKAVDRVDAEIDAWRTTIADTESAQSARRERLNSLRQNLTELDSAVREATGGRGGVAERRRELAELVRRTRRFRDARQEAARARDRVAGATARLSAACLDAGFDDLAAVRAAFAPDTQIAAWDTMLQEAASLRAAAEETLADDDVRAAMSAPEPDLERLTVEREAARRRLETAAKEHAVTARQAAGLEEYVTQFWAALDALAPMQERHAELQGLAELVSGRGQNSRRMSLRSYVLAARLDEVLVAASGRLREMSSGRYEFVHTDAAGVRGRRGGLGIEVRDEYTGALRATTTLSGGETFFASLALALGLADVVSAESGGRVLDTIFIDEGFGTLDPEALDLVMGVLDDLRTGGRVVGVVSHVDELRARIPAQLHVLRGEHGSSVRVQSPLGVS
ncbi:ATPase involved in DNA repair [Gordonia terrae C-6]|uniref:Nuclease SbcCD subunit C n=1 Tax=Gordonia terrae C-6 TaxID=1316928 RepID=R7Y8S5_9ACTN|nr:SMC family ATPase [Gordonia terrae]EON32431.1 ATPase involved in DNA repair [Gordonia terrae C-6]